MSVPTFGSKETLSKQMHVVRKKDIRIKKISAYTTPLYELFVNDMGDIWDGQYDGRTLCTFLTRKEAKAYLDAYFDIWLETKEARRILYAL